MEIFHKLSYQRPCMLVYCDDSTHKMTLEFFFSGQIKFETKNISGSNSDSENFRSVMSFSYILKCGNTVFLPVIDKHIDLLIRQFGFKKRYQLLLNCNDVLGNISFLQFCMFTSALLYGILSNTFD